MQTNQRVRHTVGALACIVASIGLMPAAANNAGAPPKADSAVAAAIRQKIESRFPGAHVMDIQPAAVAGLYELFMGDQIVYTDAAGDHLFVGSMIDTQSKQNLTEASLNDHGKIDFKTLPVGQAIKVVKGNGSRVFAVFSDPDCPFCQQLEKTLLQLNDFTMYVYLFPISSLHPQAPAKAHAIWCAADRTKAWSEWMHEKKLPPTRTCAGDPVDALQKLGDTLHINSTPTMFFTNGKRIAGAIPAPDLDKALAANSVPQHSEPSK